MSTIVIYRAFDAFYYSFYIKGLIETFGESNIRFSAREFPKLPPEYFSFIYKGERDRRFIIDAYDGQISPHQHAAIEWCDIFGKVNLRASVVAKEFLPKCLPIGPSFPIRVWSPTTSWWNALRNYRPGIQGRALAHEHFANYTRQYRDKMEIEHFAPGQSKDDYIFFSSTIWRDHEAPRTNKFRASYMKCCKELSGVTFEGGFSPTDSAEQIAKYGEHIAPKRYPQREWLDKIKSSAVVFNTPAVWQSHTFKLAEFLAMGKAIISTPLVNDMPSPLVHGQHVHYVNGSEDATREALHFIIKDRDYRKRLEQNARKYYETYLTPKFVIESMLNHTNQNKTPDPVQARR